MSEVEIVVTGSTELADATKRRIDGLRNNLTDSMIDLAELLHEVKSQNLFHHYGYLNFSDWLEKGSELDISRRTGFYLCNIIEKSRKLGISKLILKATKLSKLREIFSLDDVKHAEDMKKLLIDSSKMTLNEIQNEIQKLESGDKDKEPFTFITLKIPQSGRDNSVDPAVELCRRMYGSVPNRYTGEIGDISTSYALELICNNYLMDPNNKSEDEFESAMMLETTPTIPVEAV